MALTAFLQLKHSGRSRDDRFVIVLKDDTRITVGLALTTPYPDIGFCVPQESWSDELVKAASELQAKFEAASNKAFHLSHVTAWIDGESCRAGELLLALGSPLTVTLRYARWTKAEASVTFKSPPVDLQPLC